MRPSESTRPADDNRMTPAGERRRLYLYLLPLVLFPILLFVLSFFILPTRWFEDRSGNTYLANLGYAAKLHGKHCDVLISGDSSAMVGVDPAIIEARTGLTACNIAEFEGMTMIDRTGIVDLFLRNNPRPKYIVFLYVPESLTVPKEWVGVSTFEAISFNIEHMWSLKMAMSLLAHPNEIFGWTELGLRMAAQRVHSAPFPASVLHMRERDGGLLRSEYTVAKRCSPAVHKVAPDLAWVASIRSEYGVDGTKVLVDATPTAPCDLGLAFYHEHLDGLIDNSPYSTIPLEDFQDSGRLHANDAGIKLISAMIAEQIARGMKDGEPQKISAMRGGR